MKETKDKIVSRLGTLDKVRPVKPSAMDLHGSRPLMSRVQRQEDRLYKQRVQEQQKKFKLKLQKIEKYYKDIQKEEKRRLDLLEDWQGDDAPVFQPIDAVVPKPVIGISGMPVQRRTRLHLRAKAKGLRRLR